MQKRTKNKGEITEASKANCDKTIVFVMKRLAGKQTILFHI